MESNPGMSDIGSLPSPTNAAGPGGLFSGASVSGITNSSITRSSTMFPVQFRVADDRARGRTPGSGTSRNAWFLRNRKLLTQRNTSPAKPPHGESTHDQKDHGEQHQQLHGPSPMHTLTDDCSTRHPRHKPTKPTPMAPEALVMFMKTSRLVSPHTRRQMKELHHQVEDGITWSLAPTGLNSLEDPKAQMAELEKFVPRPMINLMSAEARAYKKGKWTEHALIPWDYYRERTDALTELSTSSPAAQPAWK